MRLGLGLSLRSSRPRRNGQDGSAISFLPGEIADDGEFVTPPTVVAIASGIQFNGKKTSGASGKFIYDVGTAAAGTSYTMRYDPDFSRLANGGVTAMVGFGFRTANDFHLVGLKGDGGSGLVEHRVHGTSPDGWNKNTGHTSVSGAAAAHGTQAGPNYVRITISADGLTYTFATSSDGSTFTDEFSNIAPTPFSAATAAAQFGIAVYLQAADAGEFSVDITLWQSGAAAPAGDPFFTSVVLLDGFEGTDGSTAAYTAEVGGHTINISGTGHIEQDQKKYGNTSLFVGTGGANCADSANWDLSNANSDQFTIEYALYQTNFAGAHHNVLRQDAAGQQCFIIRHTSGGELTFFGSSDGISFNISITTSGLSPTNNTWIEYCIEKDATGKIRIYKNGVMKGSGTPADSSLFNSNQALQIGAAGEPTHYMDELRITKGVARYASDSGYTPTGVAFPRS